ncbi:hypothetical protein GCM10007423_12000 [Dyadobacter endophyticus]|uniref:Uncharacterized protein n=1 Tax=Dyadobacter endophyticus TaxID=1749036 RepID=A0ABQ1YJA1_9BACT|nr:hypothetical protein [Dyadobacter endophyticus]GGH26766.1 hypothetical protein GCM10007423_12000 [Dyadobacter endophyticus]
MNSEKRMTTSGMTSSAVFYAVYDSDGSEQVLGRELAFIEQRIGSGRDSDPHSSDEVYFDSLYEAKIFVRDNFLFGAEYFSSKQLNDPDNVLYALADKFTYLMT